MAEMRRLALLCPGQGAQRAGMGRDLVGSFDTARRLFREADDALGYPISRLCFEGPESDLALTANTQPAILAVSVAAATVLRELAGVDFAVAGGHSLGEYSALVMAGSLGFADAVRLVHHRGQYMQEAVPVGKGAMAAVLGLDRERITAICAGLSTDADPVQAVNLNCPGQTVIAGATGAVGKAVDALKAAGAARCVPLPVSAPFHSSLMRPAAERLARELESVAIRDAAFPVASNFTGRLQRAAGDIKRNLIAQADHPVLWEDCVAAMAAESPDLWVEAGPGRTLCGFSRRIDRRLRCASVEDAASLRGLLDTLR